MKFRPLNELLDNGGIPVGSLAKVLIDYEPVYNKSMLRMNLITEAVKRGATFMYLDIEGTMFDGKVP